MATVTQGGHALLHMYGRVSQLTTWTGDIVSNDAQVRGNTITFRRKRMVFRGRLPKDSDAFHFRRIS